MKRPVRIALISAGSLAALAVALGAIALVVAHSGWLSEKLRTMVIEQAETATGGKVEIAKFQLDWKNLAADVDGFVIHGTEPAGQAPFLKVDHVTIGFRIVSLLTRDIRLARIEVTHPAAHLIVAADGGTNIPRPKTHGTARTADTILNLKIGQFSVRNGEVFVESPGNPPHTYPWSGQGKNLAALATYDRARDRYAGSVSLAPLHLTLEDYGPLDVDFQAAAAMERNRVTVSKATIKSAGSAITLTGVNIGTAAAPVVTADYEIDAASAEAIRALHWKLPVQGPLQVSGKARYVSPEEFETSGTFRGTGLSYGGRVRNIRISGNVALDQNQLSLTSIRASLLGGQASGSVITKGYDVFRIQGKMTNLGVRSLAALATPQEIPWDGQLSGTVEATGRIRELSTRGLTAGDAQLTIAGPVANGEISAHYAGRKLDLANSWLQLPHTRADVSGTLGATLTVKAVSTDLSDVLPLLKGKALPIALQNGEASFEGTVTGAIDDLKIVGHAEAKNAVYQKRTIESAAADLTATKSGAAVTNAAVVYDGVTAKGAGSIALTDWGTTDDSAIRANAAVSNLDMPHALALAGEPKIPLTGSLSVSARLSGTLADPTGDANITLSKGTAYQQPFDSIAGQAQYASGGLLTAKGAVVAGLKRVTFEASYPRSQRQLKITASSNVMALNQIALVKQRQPDIQGNAQFNGAATLTIRPDNSVELANMDGTASATGIKLGGRDLGDSHIVAKTQGSVLTATFDSNAASAAIKGQARVELTGDYRATGSITFSDAGLNALAAAAVTEAEAKNLSFDGVARGQVDFSGPLLKPAEMSGTATVSQLEVHPLPASPLAKSIPGFSLKSAGPLKISLDKGVLRVDSAHFLAPETDMTLSGTADIHNSAPLNLRADGTVNLAMLRSFAPDLAASGTVTVKANLRGGWSTPDLNGSASIRNGELHYADFTNGLSNVTGEILFFGSRAQIQSFTAETGGGKLTGSGFATLTNGNLGFQFSAKTKDVRLRYPQGISSVSDADIQMVRNAQRSSISGTVTVRRLVFNPQQDTAGILADVSQTAPVPATGSGSLAGMNLDILIQTAPDVALQSKVAESIQADATLRLRGTVSNPGMVGRVNISQGSVLFFGNKYTISRGTVSFYDPTAIAPILDVDLQTRARGVDVTLTVTGPPSHLGFTYRSDPPLEFADIVALLATGRTPDDPSLALRGNAPTPTFEQLGASTLIGQTLATPLAGRLQRFFGVSRIKIDPQLAGVGGTPGARLTVEQQVTPDLLFTYVTDVSNTSQQLIRAEWAFNPRWSAILAREENGYVGVDFEYKRRFK